MRKPVRVADSIVTGSTLVMATEPDIQNRSTNGFTH